MMYKMMAKDHDDMKKKKKKEEEEGITEELLDGLVKMLNAIKRSL